MTWIIVLLIALILLFFMYKNKPEKEEKSLYDRLGGIYSIAALVNYYSDRIVENPIVGKNTKNPALKAWYENKMSRLPGLKFMRTLWVAGVAGGPYKYVPTVPGKKCPFNLENSHAELKILPNEFDAASQELSKAIDHFGIPSKEKDELLSILRMHKSEINSGYLIANGQPVQIAKCPFS